MRQPDGVAESTPIADKAQLAGLLEGVFGLTLPAETEGLDRYLS